MFWPGSYQSPSYNTCPGISYNKPTAGQSTQSKQCQDDLAQVDQITELRTGRVRMVNEQPSVVNPLSVSIQPCGKKRLILDLRDVNKSLIKQSVEYEDWEIAMAYFAKVAYMFSFLFKKRLSPYRYCATAPTFAGVFMAGA